MAKELTGWEHMTKRGGFLDARLGKGWSAPFTGYGWAALRAFIGLAEAWYQSDMNSRPRVEVAMREVLATMQESERPAARMTIYGVGNEDAMLKLWPAIVEGGK